MAQFSFKPKLVVNQVVTRGVGYKGRLYDQVSKYSCLKILVKFYDCERVYMHDVADFQGISDGIIVLQLLSPNELYIVKSVFLFLISACVRV